MKAIKSVTSHPEYLTEFPLQEDVLKFCYSLGQGNPDKYLKAISLENVDASMGFLMKLMVEFVGDVDESGYPIQHDYTQEFKMMSKDS